MTMLVWFRFRDLLIHVRRASTRRFVVPRRFRALAPTVAVLLSPALAQTQLVAYHGSEVGDRCGYMVSGAGDVDRDGFDDVILSIPGVTGKGLVQIRSGRTNAVLYSFAGKAPFDGFGEWTSGVGDINRDGFDDIAVGARGDDLAGPDFGGAFVFSGRDGAQLLFMSGPSQKCWFGVVSKAGDVDADGYDDVVVGAYFDKTAGPESGSAFVYSGKTGAQLWKFSADSPGDWLGLSVDGIGDIDHDGHDDVLVGAPYDGALAPYAGTARVHSGRTGQVLLSIHGDHAFDTLGWSVAGAGDVNADGFPDAVLGATGSSVGGIANGAVFVHSGKDGSRLFAFHGHHDYDYLGWTVDGAGDVNGDGYGDVVLGSYNAWFGHGFGYPVLSGKAHVISGREGTPLLFVHGGAQTDSFAYCVAGAGDVDGDGLDDIIVGEPQLDRGTTNTGAAHVYSSCPLPPVVYCTSKSSASSGTPHVMSSGSATLGGADDFFLTATGLVPHGSTWLVVGWDSQQPPLVGGGLCVAPPIERVSVGKADASGTARFHASHAWMAALGLGVGSNVFVQFVGREPTGAADALAWTQGLHITVCE
jgi:hypothetical protein